MSNSVNFYEFIGLIINVQHSSAWVNLRV